MLSGTFTTMPQAVDEHMAKDGVFIPMDLKAGILTQFAFNNVDFHEYTRDGRTLHGTTHIVFRNKNAEEDPTTVNCVPLLKVR